AGAGSHAVARPVPASTAAAKERLAEPTWAKVPAMYTVCWSGDSARLATLLSRLGFQPSPAPAVMSRLARLFRTTLASLIQVNAPPTNRRVPDTARVLTAAPGDAENDVSTVTASTSPPEVPPLVSGTKPGTRTPLPSRAATLWRATPLTLVKSPPAKTSVPSGEGDTAWTVLAAAASKPGSTAPEWASRAARYRCAVPPMAENAPPA